MHIGVALPTGIPQVEAGQVVPWARQVEDGPFASIAVLDRLVYDSYEPLVALSAAAAVTSRVQLATTILIAPLRNTTLLAKQLASIDRLSGGRLVVGVGIGARQDDYEITGVDTARRGAKLADQLVDIPALFESGRLGLGTGPRSRPRFLTGGMSGAALSRMARHSDGYIHGGGPPRVFKRAADEARAAWIDAGRPGVPAIWGQAYFAFGDAAKAGADYVRDYYGFTGAFADKIASGLLTTEQQAVEFMQAYAEAGCDHLVMLPGVADRTQLDRLADAVAEAGLGADAAREAQGMAR
ncbi:MAG TPA: LLM class flavin-dependent oxidoreductase [Streptosporangiaceae bacterium]|jgi:alkanesulfonate monooxygenase SsuD/methylene tetrahydromethanopterin reductase-like flavin-dependent oxidoreductase (luciferase family)|nr:LLM class flavin-dependent oxidoreductase [Streptosporangiaceae bacterium]